MVALVIAAVVVIVEGRPADRRPAPAVAVAEQALDPVDANACDTVDPESALQHPHPAHLEAPGHECLPDRRLGGDHS